MLNHREKTEANRTYAPTSRVSSQVPCIFSDRQVHEFARAPEGIRTSTKITTSKRTPCQRQSTQISRSRVRVALPLSTHLLRQMTPHSSGFNLRLP